MRHFEPGQVVVLRDVWRGMVLSGRPVRVVRDTDDLAALYLAPGTEWAIPTFSERMEGYERAASGDVVPRGRRTWHTHHNLILMRPGDAYSPHGFWNEAGDLVCWYVNLQLPMNRTRIGFDTMDAVLDLVVAPDLSSWQWKDEQELDRVVELGLASPELAAEIRASGESVIALIERVETWWTDWAGWAPDPDWSIPVLPEGWDAL